jgi:hypothetical protein
MDAKKINAVEMTRKIRDEHAKRLAGKSHAERIAFYRERAKKSRGKWLFYSLLLKVDKLNIRLNQPLP